MVGNDERLLCAVAIVESGHSLVFYGPVIDGQSPCRGTIGDTDVTLANRAKRGKEAKDVNCFVTLEAFA
jgi:hypothetical protein